MSEFKAEEALQADLGGSWMADDNGGYKGTFSPVSGGFMCALFTKYNVPYKANADESEIRIDASCANQMMMFTPMMRDKFGGSATETLERMLLDNAGAMLGGNGRSHTLSRGGRRGGSREPH